MQLAAWVLCPWLLLVTLRGWEDWWKNLKGNPALQAFTLVPWDVHWQSHALVYRLHQVTHVTELPKKWKHHGLQSRRRRSETPLWSVVGTKNKSGFK